MRSIVSRAFIAALALTAALAFPAAVQAAPADQAAEDHTAEDLAVQDLTAEDSPLVEGQAEEGSGESAEIPAAGGLETIERLDGTGAGTGPDASAGNTNDGADSIADDAIADDTQAEAETDSDGSRLPATPLTQRQPAVYKGLDYSPIFDPVYYEARYPDLAAYYRGDTNGLFSHFLLFGMKEGRQAADNFSVLSYKNRYRDLRLAFWNDLPAYCRHYLNYGMKEGRVATGYDDKVVDPEINYCIVTPLGTSGARLTILNPNENAGVSKVLFPTWSDDRGQDDLVWYVGTKVAEGKWTVDV